MTHTHRESNRQQTSKNQHLLVVHGQKKKVHSIFAVCDCIIFYIPIYSLPILRSLLLFVVVLVWFNRISRIVL